MANPFARFFGRTISEGAAFAAGTAVGPALRPVIQELENLAWARAPERPLSAGDAAGIVAEDVERRIWGEDEAGNTGVNAERFAALLGEALNAPGLAELFEAWRRDLIDDDAFEHGLRKAKLEPRWDAPLKALKQRLLSPQDLAMARQQGFVTEARQKDESARSGVNDERAEILFEMSGLPPGVERALTMLRRNIIGEAEFRQIVREGHEKTKYTEEELALERELLSPATLVALHLRGWIGGDEFHRRMLLWGYEAGDADDWFRSAGRPMAPVQMFNAWSRGIDGPDGRPMDEAQFIKGIRESDIRPEWAETLWGIRWAYPSLFQLRRAVEDGAISPARARTILHYERYEQEDADGLIRSWTMGTATTSRGLTATDLATEYEGLYATRDFYISELQTLGYTAAQAAEKANAIDARRVRQARNQAISRIRSVYTSHRIDRAEAAAALDLEQVPEPARDLILTEWEHERAINVAVLTPAQIRKAYKKVLWSRAQALAELEERGYSTADANTFLDE